jgi:cell division protease FtsH
MRFLYLISQFLVAFSLKPHVPLSTSFRPSELINKFSGQPIGSPWGYTEFMEKLEKSKIDAVSLLGNHKDNLVAIDSNYEGVDNIKPDNLHFVKILPDTYNFVVEQLTKSHVNTDVFDLPPSIFEIIGKFGSSAFQLMIFLVIGSYIYQILAGFPGGTNPMNSINDKINGIQASGEVINSEEISTSFEDVAGCDEAKFELTEIVDFLKNPDKYADAGAKIPKGVLLEGNPGTGKTLLARAVAGEAGVPFISASGSEFIEMFVGVGAARVRNLFDKAKSVAPCVIFIDEIDAVGRQRGAGVAGGNDEREQTLNQILTNMDGFETDTGIVVLAATNRIDILDNALTRPGRFDRKINVPLPDLEGRVKISEVHFKNKKVKEDVDLNEIASLTSGFSGADIANLANEAAIYSVRKNQTTISRENILDAYEKITIGITSNVQEKDEQVIDLVSYHETGHALTAALFPEFFDVRKVTINANKGGAGGYTLFTPKDRFQKYATKKYMLANLIVALGGRAAEIYLYGKNSKSEFDQLVFNGFDNLDVTTGASNDLMQAKKIARNYITQFGFSETGSYLLDDSDPDRPFLGRDMASNKGTSERTKFEIDQEVSKLIDFALTKALDLIKLNEKAFLDTVKLLKEERIISGSQINDLL